MHLGLALGPDPCNIGIESHLRRRRLRDFVRFLIRGPCGKTADTEEDRQQVAMNAISVDLHCAFHLSGFMFCQRSAIDSSTDPAPHTLPSSTVPRCPVRT